MEVTKDMLVNDFEYDGLLLSDFGCIICSFGSGGGLETVTNGSNITFNTSPILKGTKFVLTNTQYEECLSAIIQICKNPCNLKTQEDAYFNIDEQANIMRWLNRKEFLKLKLLKEGYENVFFEGSFNVSKVIMGDDCIGFELSLTTNAPFGFYETVKKTFYATSSNYVEAFRDISDEIGFIYPEVEITCNATGDLVIHNEIENRETIIKNCVAGEVITMKSPVISSSITEHKIQNDFNYNFFRIANSYRDNVNQISFSLPCTMKISYNPIRKVGV